MSTIPPRPPDLLALARALDGADAERAAAFRALCLRYGRRNCGWWRRRYRELAEGTEATDA